MTKYFFGSCISGFASSFSRLSAAVILTCLLSLYSSESIAQTSADQTFTYIENTLGVFRGTGRLVDNPGIDGADLEAFIEFLEQFESEFTEEFSGDSAMCSYYLDPENSRMTIEERAEIAFLYLSDEDVRLSRFNKIAQDFDAVIEEEFGTIVLDRINELKPLASSHQRLPPSQFDEAAVISFLDSACI